MNDEEIKTSHHSEDLADQPTYTLKQAREILNVSNTTIFRLASNNDITGVEYVSAFNPNRTVTHYTQESVHAYRDRSKGIITVKDIVKEYGLNSSFVFNVLKENNLEYTINDVHFSKPTAVISEEIATRLCELLAQKIQKSENPSRKSDFYRNGYGFLQKMESPDGTVCRLLFGDNENKNKLGVMVGINDFKSIKVAIKEGYLPAYEIAKLPSTRVPYIVIEASMYGPIVEIIDAAYAQIGYKNMYIKPSKEGNINLYLKECTLKFSDTSEFTEEWLASLTIQNNGSIKKAGMELTFLADKKVTVKIDDSVHSMVSTLAKQMNKSPNEVLEELASSFLKNMQNSDFKK
ncbi:hypothetical protein [Solibacillus sp. NPDC093137]|uniref:hypothetical protein n=1 Tax=Solibacillus sp. NPDC093137 TaxID=3390678 RepID=UPI003CFBE533